MRELRLPIVLLLALPSPDKGEAVTVRISVVIL